MGHVHGAEARSAGRRLVLGFTLTLIFTLVEIIVGFLANSLALLSDAGHMSMDTLALGFAVVIARVSERRPDSKRTYGYKRLEVLSGIFNGVLLLFVVYLIIKESIERLSDPPELQGLAIGLVGLAGLLINVFVAILLNPARKVNLNIRGAYLHVLGDLLGSVGVVIAGLGVWLFGWKILDPIAAMAVSAIIAYSSVRLVREGLHVLLEGTPRTVSVEKLRGEIRSIEGVRDIHDVHVWTIGGGFDVLTAHVVGEEGASSKEIRKAIRRFLAGRYGIRHVTIQMEDSGSGEECHPPCEEEVNGTASEESRR
jgi:cobalt-zinc-cadmium efflux system protein